ncbi:MarR family winged helix-turn-helix transcriptional regulator [Sphingomonas sp. Y38-1Y]|jgi:DNA-binding MarR family transcriptional regulator|uniref:MarR family winged helix-turn-helix transcriptional regulator n=1 Tax=Sphingomonas sp. Y38-1Y TaxID=3078265 RepID=UPI0028E85979|nr:MarR family transcriptional regulator [Sphingomonas sp. Y38-1Y]
MNYRCDDLARLLAGTYMRLHRKLDAAMAAEGASLARTKMLLMIQKQAGEARAADLAAWLNQAPRTVTEALDGLERDGLIARIADPSDRRVKRVTITEEGERAIAATEPLRQRLTTDLFGPLSDDERNALGATLEKLIQRLDLDPSCTLSRP